MHRFLSKIQLLSLTTAGLCLCAGSLGAHDDVKNELKQLQGKWKLASVVVDGVEQPLPTGTMVIMDNTAAYQYRNTFGRSIFTIDPGKSPKTWDDRNTAGPWKGTTTQSIYKLEGDVLTYCVQMSPDAKRPTEFAAPPGSGRQLQVWVRVQR
jgi:uncharacterized protein (TIGR03067 family)